MRIDTLSGEGEGGGGGRELSKLLCLHFEKESALKGKNFFFFFLVFFFFLYILPYA